MNAKTFSGAVAGALLLLVTSSTYAQSGDPNMYWHTDPGVKTCSMVIDPSLTQAQWHKFTEQVGAVSSFKSMASAKTLGTMNFRVGIDYGSTPVDQRDPAWINTFTHPGKECPLGDAIVYPTLRAAMGVSDNMDVGGFWTVAPGANYGLIGGEFKYALLKESEKFPAAAVRASFAILTGVSDFDLDIYSIDALASKQIAMVTPYVGIRTSLVVGTETTTKVNLSKENVAIVQGYAGVSVPVWVFNLAAEYNVSTVNTFALAIGVDF